MSSSMPLCRLLTRRVLWQCRGIPLRPHAAACVLIAFVRPYLLKLMAPRDGYEGERPLSLQVMGFGWFITYCLLMVFMHHAVLFYLEVFRLNEFFSTLFRMLLSMILTVGLILLTEFFFFKTKSE